MNDIVREDRAGQAALQSIKSAQVPDVTDSSYQAQVAALADHAQTAFNEVLAQYRFMGLVCGIKGPNDTDQDVTDAREAIMEAISDFLHPEGGPIHAQIGKAWREYIDLRDSPNLFDQFDTDEALIISDAIHGISMGHPADTGSYLSGIANGSRIPDVSGYVDAGVLSSDGEAYINRAAQAYQRAAQLEQTRREIAAERRRQWWNDVWSSIRSYYDENLELIRNGQWLLATGRIAIDAAIFAAEEIVIAGIVGGIIAVTGGLAAGVALALRAGVRAALSVARQGTRVVRNIRATWDFKIELRKVEPGVLYSNPIPVSISVTRKLDYEKRINVETDLTPDEARAMGEGGQGSTRPDVDPPEQGETAAAPPQDPPPYRHPRDGDPPRSREELLPNGRVPYDADDPTVFQDWWDDLSYKELNDLSTNQRTRERIAERIRNGGGEHEWLKVSQQLEHKRLGFSMREIQDWVTATRDAEGPLPTPTAAGATRWRHNPEGGGRGSGTGSRTLHNSLDALYDPPPRSRNELLRRMGYWANSYIDGGVNGLPSGLRDAINNAGGG